MVLNVCQPGQCIHSVLGRKWASKGDATSVKEHPGPSGSNRAMASQRCAVRRGDCQPSEKRCKKWEPTPCRLVPCHELPPNFAVPYSLLPHELVINPAYGLAPSLLVLE